MRVPCTQRPNLGPNAPIGVPISGPKRVRWVRGVLCNFIAIHCRTPSRTSSLSSWLITTRVKVTVLTTLARGIGAEVLAPLGLRMSSIDDDSTNTIDINVPTDSDGHPLNWDGNPAKILSASSTRHHSH